MNSNMTSSSYTHPKNQNQEEEEEEEEEKLRAALNNYFILSHDTLRGTFIDQSLFNGWPDQPPLIPRPATTTTTNTHNNEQQQQEQQLLKDYKLKCRHEGIADPLECAVWLANTYYTVHYNNNNAAISPTSSKSFLVAEAFATLGKIQFIEHSWKCVTDQCFPNSNNNQDLYHFPTFAQLSEEDSQLLNKTRKSDYGATEEGWISLQRILCAIEHLLSVEYCPLLPDIAAVLLTRMTESCAYFTLREMLSSAEKFLPVTKVNHYAQCRTFYNLLKKFYPKTALYMDTIGATAPEGQWGLAPIFHRFFIQIIPFRYVLRIMDMYTLEGNKIFFRIGIALISMYKKQLKAMQCSTAQQWWQQIAKFTHNPASFDFSDLVKRAWGIWGSSVHRKRVNFPKRRFINRLHKVNERWASERAASSDITDTAAPPRPLELATSSSSSSSLSPNSLLAAPALVRASLAKWLPYTLRDTKLELIFSTNEHGRSLDMFYTHCAVAKHTIVLLEVLDTGRTIGMFATETWHQTSHVYGDGGCFLFHMGAGSTGDDSSIDGGPQHYPWQPPSVNSDEMSTEDDALSDQFMMSTSTYIAMGGARAGFGIRLDDDLTLGGSVRSLTYQNDPLAGMGMETFEVGTVEVYRFLRTFDSKPVDHIVDHSWKYYG